MADCTHHLALAAAIQDERDPAKRLDMLRDLQEPARSPVLAFLWAEAQRHGKAAQTAERWAEITGKRRQCA